MQARLKVATACTSCRRKKTKCDAQQPVCRPCREKGELICIYERKPNSTGGRTRQTHTRLRPGRIQKIPIKSKNPDPSSGLPSFIAPGKGSEPTMRETGDITEVPGRTILPDMATALPPGLETIHLTRHQSQSPRRDEYIAHEADAMTGITEDSSTSKEFFGPSNASSFIRQVSTFVNSHDESHTDQYVQPNRASNAQSKVTIDHHNYLLPPRRYADDLLVAYYDLVWAVFPILDRTVLQKAYEGCWLGLPPAMSDDTLYCMLNLIFALGSQFSEAVEPGRRKETGLSFWDRARRLFRGGGWNASLERVQCLLLMGLYLQSTSETQECWMTVGSAIRMAQSLGLHSGATRSGALGRREDQIARRVWHGCVYQDRVLSMTFGRPSMIAKWLPTSDDLPSMIDDEFLDTQTQPSAVRPDGGATVMAFFCKSLELYDVINDILIELYLSPKGSRRKGVELGLVLDLDNRMIEWAQSLPSHLRYPVTDPSEMIAFRRQRVVLRARYLQARMILFRPVLADLYLIPQSSTKDATQQEHGLSHCMIVECAKLCFKAAHEMLDVLHTNFDFETVSGPVPAWWFSVLCNKSPSVPHLPFVARTLMEMAPSDVYTAATIILSERLGSICGPGQVSRRWKDSWARVVELLGAYSRVGESAKRCTAALGLLLTKIQGAMEMPRGQEVDMCKQTRKQSVSIGIPERQDIDWLSSIEPIVPLPNLDEFNFDVYDSSWLIAPNTEIF